MGKRVVDKRSAVLQAALALIAEEGFHAAPMSRIAQQAGVAAGTIYHYFSSKDDMIVALYAHLKEKMGAALVLNDDPEQPIKSRFFALWNNLFQYFTDNPTEFMFLEQYANSPFITRETRSENQAFYQGGIDFLQQGMETGVLRPMNLSLMTALVFGSIAATAKLHLQEDLAVKGKHLQDACQSAWDSVKIT